MEARGVGRTETTVPSARGQGAVAAAVVSNASNKEGRAHIAFQDAGVGRALVGGIAAGAVIARRAHQHFGL